ncbi:MAG: tetratricopeptide repeat protein [Hydrococcus sp. Prado102]|jgi:regulator of sirC expression with transglutaminase-like and TPR domain|nr:tetratricopeptide repeat protein [Hydrococcus sp. Prado102]
MKFSIERQNFHREINRVDSQIDLAKASLFLAQEEYPELDPQEYINILDRMAEEVQKRLTRSPYPLTTIKTINQYLFEELGFLGNTDDYYDPRNSFLNDVIDRKTGIPITLSVVYLEIAKRISFPMVGIGMPGHFLIRPNFEGSGIFVDVFNRGEILFEQDCEERLRQVYQQPVKLEAHFLAPVSNKQILARMLANLKFIYLNRQELLKAIAVVERILLLVPDNHRELRDKGLLYYQLGEWQQASMDLNLYLTRFPDAEDVTTIRNLLEKIKPFI